MNSISMRSQIGASRARTVHDYSDPMEHYRTLIISETDHRGTRASIRGLRSGGRTKWGLSQFDAAAPSDLQSQSVPPQRRNAVSSRTHQLTHALIEIRLLEAINHALERRVNQLEAKLHEHNVASHSVSSVADAPYVSLQDKLTQLENLAGLRQDWDSYGADPPSARAIAVAARVIVEVQEQYRGSASSSAVPLAIVPLSGGVQLEWCASTGSVEIEIDKDGQIGFLLESGIDPDVGYEEGNSITVDRAVDLAVNLIRR